MEVLNWYSYCRCLNIFSFLLRAFLDWTILEETLLSLQVNGLSNTSISCSVCRFMHRCYGYGLQEVSCHCYSIWRGGHAFRWIFSATRTFVAILASIRYLHVIFIWCSPQHRVFQFSNIQVRLTVCLLYLFTHYWCTNSPLKTTCLAGKAYIVETYFLKRPCALNKNNSSPAVKQHIENVFLTQRQGLGIGVTYGTGIFFFCFPTRPKILSFYTITV